METPRKVSIIYEKNKNAISFPVSGAYGGPTPDRLGIVVHFYIEYPTVPHSTNLQVNNDIVDFTHGENISRGDFTREIQATTYLTPETAIVIGNWLINHGQEAKNRPDEKNE
jgi:hypothetical protein